MSLLNKNTRVLALLLLSQLAAATSASAQTQLVCHEAFSETVPNQHLAQHLVQHLAVIQQPQAPAVAESKLAQSPIDKVAPVDKVAPEDMPAEHFTNYLWDLILNSDEKFSDLEILSELNKVLGATQANASEFFRNEASLSQSADGESAIVKAKAINVQLLKDIKKLERVVSMNPSLARKILRRLGMIGTRRIEKLSESIRTKQVGAQTAAEMVKKEKAICLEAKEKLAVHQMKLSATSKKLQIAAEEFQQSLDRGVATGATAVKIKSALLPAIEKARIQVIMLEQLATGTESALNLRDEKLKAVEVDFGLLTTVTIPNLALQSTQKLDLSPRAPAPLEPIYIGDGTGINLAPGKKMKANGNASPVSLEARLDAAKSMIRDKSWETRRAGVQALARIEGDLAGALLVSKLLDSDTDVVAAAKDALRSRRQLSEELIEPLVVAKGRGNWEIRLFITGMLMNINSAKTRPLLYSICSSDADADVRRKALEGIKRKAATRDEIPLIRQLLSASDWELRRTAVSILEQVDDQEAVLKVLTESLSRENDSDVRDTLRRAIARRM